MATIEIEKLSKSYWVYQKQEGLRASLRGLFRREYREVRAVREVDLTVEQGEFVAFLGPNGAGKTTTLKLLSGVISPSSGTARVMGHVPWQRENAYRRRFALVMGQKNQLWWDLPAQESLRLHQQIYRVDGQRFQQTLDELTRLLGVTNLLHQPVRELSLGERMKMELIAALLHSPDVLFLDEPTIGLDVVAQHAIQQFLKYYQQKRRITILLTSHYMKDVSALCKRVVIIADGRLHYDGSLSGIVDRFSGHKVVTLHLAEGQAFEQLARFGTLLEIEPPKAKLRVARRQVPSVMAALLSALEYSHRSGIAWSKGAVRAILRNPRYTGREVWNKQPFSMSYWTGRPTQDQVYSVAYLSNAEWNDTRFFRPDFDKLILEARGELDEAKRKALYRQAGLLLRDEGGVIVPMFNNYLDASGPRVGGWADDPNGELMGSYALIKCWVEA